MPTTLDCNHDQRRLTIVRSGSCTMDDLIDSVVRMRTMNVWSYSVLVDAREATTALLAVETHALVARVNTIGDGKERGPIAVVAGDDVTFGMVRMFAALAEPIGMRVSVFRQVSDAERWLQQRT